MATTPPPLGYGTRGEAPIDSVNQWMRGQPWYQQLLASWGQSPSNVHLNDGQKQQIIRAAQANGVVVDEGHNGQEVDDSGNFQAKSHALRNTLIVAGIAGAALLTAGAAGVFGSAAAGGGAAGGGGAAAAGAGAAGAGAGAGTAAVVGTAAAGAASKIPWGTIVGTGTQLFGNIFAAHEASAGADRAAEIAAAGNKYSADLTAKANADALKFQYANAENAFQNNEAARSGNYGIFAARERRLGSIGDEVGLGPREIPAYVPGVDPGFGTMGEAASGGAPPASGATSGGSPSDPNAIMAALTDNYKKLGVAPTGPGSGPTDIAYFAKQIAATGGLAPNNTSYWFGPGGRIAQEITKARGGAAPTSAAPASRAAMPPTTSTPFMPPTIAAGVPQPIGSYA